MAIKVPASAVISVVLALACGSAGGCAHTGTPAGRTAESAAVSYRPAITVPALMGRQVAAAQREVHRLGLKLVPKGISPLSVCKLDEVCRIFSVRPAAGAKLPWGSPVEVGFLTAAESRFYAAHPRMPRVVGRSGAWAAVTFSPVMGLVDVSTQPGSGMAPGTDRVLFQSPDPGAPLEIGQPVKLIVGENWGGRPCGVRWWCR
ncbi:hypothetical protein [Nonomuraea typhae]|uniref:PASTA domain-containing protein n=1 Tax=Nonomuraea typhae TaxID=2603600 RepID=A0ABW7Z8Z7_9ACTN